MIIDITKCNGCYNCQIACKDEHVGNDWTPIAKPQPDTGQFWMKVKDIERGQVPKVKVAYMHSICQHCDEAPCIPACKSNAIYKRDDGAVIIDPTKCRGKKLCLDACPYGVIYFNDDLKIAQKCTFCAHLLDKGWKEPRCVDACPTGAFTFGEEEDLKDLIAKAEPLHPEPTSNLGSTTSACPSGLSPAPCLIQRQTSAWRTPRSRRPTSPPARPARPTTDSYGDFWLKDLVAGDYTLFVEKAGYLPQKMGPIDAARTSTSATSRSGRRDPGLKRPGAGRRRHSRADREGPGREARPLPRVRARAPGIEPGRDLADPPRRVPRTRT